MSNPELTHEPSPMDRTARRVIEAIGPSSPQRTSAARKMARGLGWFSIGLGLAQLLAPRASARFSGWPGPTGAVQLCGVRELVNGAALLGAREARPAAWWAWARVGGDVLDMAMLASAVAGPARRGSHPVAALASVAAIAALDVACANTLSAEAHADSVTADYSDRSGIPAAPEEMRGAALSTFTQPADMRVSPTLH